MRTVLVSHPYSNDPQGNFEKVDKICRGLVDKGYLPISPIHLFSFLDDDRLRPYIMDFIMKIIPLCDQLNYYGETDGCSQEIKRALETGVSVFEKVEDA